MIADIFIELSLLIIFSTAMAGLMKIMKQPILVGYIIAGVFAGPLFLNLIQASDVANVFSQIGIAFLLFIVGLHLDPDILKKLGKVSFITGIGQIFFTFILGFIICYFGFAFSLLVSLYIGIAFTFSSTIIVMKLLSDKGDLDSLYGRIAIAILLIQDIVAIIVLMLISASNYQGAFFELVARTFTMGLGLIFALLIFSKYLLPRILDMIARSAEFLTMFAISWCFLLAVLFNYFNFSMEIGALLAGITLAASPYHHEISSRVRVLRDFFIILFFILLGSQMQFTNISEFALPITIFSIFILIGNPLIIISIMGLLGFTKRTSFLSGASLAQISEFSFLMIALAVSVGHLEPAILSFVTTVGLITMVVSTYFIQFSKKIFPHISNFLSIFERKGVKKYEEHYSGNYNAVLFGCDRIGFGIYRTMKKMKLKTMIIDFNPEIIKELNRKCVSCKYGDIGDPDVLENIDFKNLKMIVSTVPDFESNLSLVKKIRRHNKKTVIISVAHKIVEAMNLYKTGADYVILPHFIGSEYTSHLIKSLRIRKKSYDKRKKDHIKELKLRKARGHEHPTLNYMK